MSTFNSSVKKHRYDNVSLRFISERPLDAVLKSLKSIEDDIYDISIIPIDDKTFQFSIQSKNDGDFVSGEGIINGWAAGEQTRVSFRIKEPKPVYVKVTTMANQKMSIQLISRYGTQLVLNVTGIYLLFNIIAAGTTVSLFWVLIIIGFLYAANNMMMSKSTRLSREYRTKRKQAHQLYDVIASYLS